MVRILSGRLQLITPVCCRGLDFQRYVSQVECLPPHRLLSPGGRGHGTGDMPWQNRILTVAEAVCSFAVVARRDADLAHIIHEHFCCNCGFAAATSQHAASTAYWQADSPLGRSTDCFKSASLPRSSTRVDPLLFSMQWGQRLATPQYRDEPS